VSDLRRCWQICCRVKRGLLDTSKPGAFYMDQAYFQGAVEILMHLEEVDFGRLYGGQIALQDMDKVHFILRKEVVRLPLFLNSAEKLHRYLAHCRDLMRENMIEASPEKLCKRIFVRAGLQFFKKEERTVLRTTGSSSPLLSGLASRSSDLAKTEGAPSRPTAARDEPEEGNSGIKSETPTARKSNFVRLAELAMPRCDRPPPAEDAVPGLARSVDLDRILSLARPKIWEERVQAAPAVVRISRTEEAARELALRELAKPKVRPEAPAVAEVVTGPSRPVDSERLAALAAPRRPSEPSDRPSSKEPSKRRRRKRSKLRLLALVQSRTDSESMGCGLRESPEEAADYPPEEEGEESAEGEAEDAKPIVIEVAESPSQETAMAVGSPKVQEKAEVTTAVDVQEDTPEVAAPVFAAEQGEERTSKSRPRRRSASLKAPLCRPVLARQALPIKTLMLDLGV
ncbi:KIAA0895, partial [Symbiodinium microadriaticum]